ncbi:UNVERIFIED_CONTAM: putative LRR receptor-like serine/threonine-protein kinase IRK [Sesamum calycinum]|uniref:LRR receptor-like serine/threonine-protein kinase IRK n=1 Tax=Sesamum calycinum TaxID=2727403 RepID=A0AAW2RQ18_9LAMI
MGEVPQWIGDMRSLVTIDLSENNFTGQVPDSLGKLQSVKILNVSKNALTGSLPEAMSNCQVLLSDNGLSGSIDDALASSKENSRTKLLILDVSQNKLSGEIPSSVGDLGSLQLLNMSRNSFVGTIPARIGQLKSLKFLWALVEFVRSLAHNEITGAIPASLAKLTYLTIVDFSFNRLTGSIPKQLANLASLQLFNISHNQLQVNRSCPTVLPKPIVLNPNSTDATPGTITQSLGRGKKILSISALIAIGAAAAIVIGVIAITVLNLRVRAATSRSAVALNFSGGDDFSHSPSTDGDSGKLVMFSGDPDFSTATHALLNKDCELGRGGFGAVYRTMLGDGRSVAIKKLTVSSLVKSQEDFEREVKKLGKVHHGNLVALHGYYWTPSLQLLIYEFVSGGNLYKHLHEGSAESYLSWNERFNIILGAAKGLAHLHQMNIIHYNLKSSNILIDSSGEPKVADYGLAKLLPMLDRYVLSSKIQSALGYMAPEFACKTVKITEKCDVYGFGILVLEVVTGKRPVEYMEDDVVVLSDMVRGAMEEGKVEDCVDARLLGKFPVDEAIPVIKLGLICTSQVPSNRPDMAEVVNILELIRCPSESQDELGEFS